jgi:DNA polymerase-3 subunit delta'
MQLDKPWLTNYQQDLTKQYLAKSLPHGILISGVKGSGKDSLAYWLAQLLSCQQLASSTNNQPCGLCKSCLLLKAQTHPDVKLIESDDKTLGVDTIRSLSSFAQKTAQICGNQIIVIFDAEKMTESAANALLKTLEEPTPGTFIVLVSEDSQSLLPTIISRCFQLVITAPIGQALFTSQGEGLAGNAFTNLSQLDELTNDELFAQRQQLLCLFIDWLAGHKALIELHQEIISNERALTWLLHYCQSVIRTKSGWSGAELIVSPEYIEKLESLPEDRFWSLYQLLLAVSKQVKTASQLNYPMAIEQLLVDIELLMTGELG